MDRSLPVYFILCNPEVSENVGFSLRALKTMGFESMRIVGNKDHNFEKLKKTAYGSHNLIESIKHFETLENAIQDVDLVVGTTAKERSGRRNPLSINDLKTQIENKQKSISSIAIVFGSEKNGLSNSQLGLCDAISTIPLKVDYPSLNLAQAVLIYSYELSKINSNILESSDHNKDFKVLKSKSKLVLDKIGFDEDTMFHRGVLDRVSLLKDTDIRMTLKLINKLLISLGQSKLK